MTEHEAATLATFVLSLVRMYGGITIPKAYLAENQKFDVSWVVEANGDVRIFEKKVPQPKVVGYAKTVAKAKARNSKRKVKS